MTEPRKRQRKVEAKPVELSAEALLFQQLHQWYSNVEYSFDSTLGEFRIKPRGGFLSDADAFKSSDSFRDCALQMLAAIIPEKRARLVDDRRNLDQKASALESLSEFLKREVVR